MVLSDRYVNKIRDLFKVKLYAIRSETKKKERQREKKKERQREKKKRETETDRDREREVGYVTEVGWWMKQ